ncbi:hypothetical protein LBBP_01387 [Leptospira borgpetersenii serovar Ballum]|uniref:Uncharacterized protein n=1 Tax=Leptospira borgpetersenii serovar Ballum TaxID=280505 RepID=A0A0S2IPT4_LEPBO|nr:hypothetical protein LBBP_01387 [Leptospira borgpetersenii serovar Ballum]
MRSDIGCLFNFRVERIYFVYRSDIFSFVEEFSVGVILQYGDTN